MLLYIVTVTIHGNVAIYRNSYYYGNCYYMSPKCPDCLDCQRFILIYVYSSIPFLNLPRKYFYSHTLTRFAARLSHGNRQGKNIYTENTARKPTTITEIFFKTVSAKVRRMAKL